MVEYMLLSSKFAKLILLPLYSKWPMLMRSLMVLDALTYMLEALLPNDVELLCTQMTAKITIQIFADYCTDFWPHFIVLIVQIIAIFSFNCLVMQGSVGTSARLGSAVLIVMISIYLIITGFFGQQILKRSESSIRVGKYYKLVKNLDGKGIIEIPLKGN